jgi:hypothetical protein
LWYAIFGCGGIKLAAVDNQKDSPACARKKKVKCFSGLQARVQIWSRLSHLPNEFFIAKMHSWPLAEQLNGEYDIKSLKSRTLEQQGGPYADEED